MSDYSQTLPRYNTFTKWQKRKQIYRRLID